MDESAQPIHINLSDLAEARRIIKSIQRDCRATLKLLAVLEDMHKESDSDAAQGQGN